MARPATSIDTGRLHMRVPEPDDAVPFMRVFWDPEVVEQKQVTLPEPPGGPDLALKNTRDMMRQWEQRGYGHWTIVEPSTRQVIGCVGFYHPQRPWPGVDLGWVLQRHWWGRGLATEAAAAALDWIWTHTNVDRVISLINPGDHRSIRIATKIGEVFERAGVDPVHGGPADVYAIDRPRRA